MEDHTWATGGIVQGSIDERVKPLRAAIPLSGHYNILGGIEGSDPAGGGILGCRRKEKEGGTGLVSDSRTREPPSLSGFRPIPYDTLKTYSSPAIFFLEVQHCDSPAYTTFSLLTSTIHVLLSVAQSLPIPPQQT